ncbi:MAG: Ig-like domain-containing protein [bacterium]
MKKLPYTRIFGAVFLIIFLSVRIPGISGSAQAAPVITSISPDHGPRGMNTDLTIRGAGFSPGMKVSIWGGGVYIKGSHSTAGSANSLYCSGSYVYLACGRKGGASGSSGVYIFPIENPASPQPLSFLSLPGQASDILVFDNYAYVAAEEAGFQILDVRDPAAPSCVSSLPLNGRALKVSLYGHHAYLAADYGGLQIVDIRNPRQPAPAGSLVPSPDSCILDVVTEGGYAYLAAGWAGVKIADIGHPENPAIAADFPCPGRFVMGVFKYQNYLYLSEMENGVEILDISDPLSPKAAAHLATPGLAHQVSIRGNYLYVADDYRGVEIFRHDLTQGCSLVGFQETPGWAVDLQVVDNHVFVADSQGGLQILDAENPRNPSLVSMVDLLDGSAGVEVSGLKVQGDYAYVFSRANSFSDENWLKILDVSNPKNPHVCGKTRNIGPWPEDLAISQEYAYLVDDYTGLEVFNVTYKQSPQRVSFYDRDTSGGRGIFIKDNTLLLADSLASGTAGIKIFTQDAKMLPLRLGTAGLADAKASAEAIYAAGDYAFLAAGEAGVSIFNLRDPSQPALISTLPLAGFIGDLLVAGPYVYLANRKGLIQVIDIKLPSNPHLLGSCKTAGEPGSMALSGNYLYGAEGEAGLQVIDITQPEKPLAVVSLATLTPAEEVVADGEYIYAAVRNGLMIMSALKPCPSVSSVDPATLRVSTPAGLAPGTYHLTLTDPNGSMTVLPNGFTVEANRPPVMEPIADNPMIAVTEGETLTLTIRAIDPDGDPLSYTASLSRLPQGASLSGNVFTWRPKSGDSGLYPNIWFQVTDGEFIIERTINLAVIDNGNNGDNGGDGNNTPPELGLIPSQTQGEEGKAIAFLIEAFDPDPEDRENLTITLLNAPAGATCQMLTGGQDNKVIARFLWTPDYGQAGTYTITLQASDQQLSDQKTLTLMVREAAPAPARFELKAGANTWLCPAGRNQAQYTSFTFLREMGEDALFSLQAYDWDGTPLKSCSWLFGRPCGDDFPMDRSRIYRIQARRGVSFTWPRD